MSINRIEKTASPDDPLGICDALESKVDTLEKFLETTIALKEATHNQNLTEIEACLEARESYIFQVNALDNYIRINTRENPSYFERLSIFKKEAVAKLTRSLEGLLDQVVTVNRECAGSAVRCLKIIQDGMSQTACQRSNFRIGYGKDPNPRFLDITG